ncbi:hypothetical protein EOPP23_05080 [Endozoicomonas sp. OPT23]|uniref:hypothetical protein n=1 Tax=Endozoicomonas sp. OPT23 TaxID=2072845 RepID=UPI00129AEB4F|nr:hypothetical protein [Endozoicomonas sp. OPT23]MRI32355.1 hypothetical protein [Endozoicomonas sp. OPT23]
MKKWIQCCSIILLAVSVLSSAHASPLSKDELELQKALRVLDTIRDDILQKALGAKASRQHRENTWQRIKGMSEHELIAEINRLERAQVEAAERLVGSTVNSQLFGQAYRSESTVGEDDSAQSSRYTGSARTGGTRRKGSSGSYSNAQYESSEFYDTQLADYDIEMPVIITERNHRKATQSVRVRVNPSKMKLLKQKQALNKVMINDVLGLTGKLP